MSLGQIFKYCPCLVLGQENSVLRSTFFYPGNQTLSLSCPRTRKSCPWVQEILSLGQFLSPSEIGLCPCPALRTRKSCPWVKKGQEHLVLGSRNLAPGTRLFTRQSWPKGFQFQFPFAFSFLGRFEYFSGLRRNADVVHPPFCLFTVLCHLPLVSNPGEFAILLRGCG